MVFARSLVGRSSLAVLFLLLSSACSGADEAYPNLRVSFDEQSLDQAGIQRIEIIRFHPIEKSDFTGLSSEQLLDKYRGRLTEINNLEPVSVPLPDPSLPVVWLRRMKGDRGFQGAILLAVLSSCRESERGKHLTRIVLDPDFEFGAFVLAADQESESGKDSSCLLEPDNFDVTWEEDPGSSGLVALLAFP